MTGRGRVRRLWDEVQLDLPFPKPEAAGAGKSCARPRTGRNRAGRAGAKSGASASKGKKQ